MCVCVCVGGGGGGSFADFIKFSKLSHKNEMIYLIFIGYFKKTGGGERMQANPLSPLLIGICIFRQSAERIHWSIKGFLAHRIGKQSNLGYPNVDYPKLLGYSTTDSPDFFLYYLLQ